MKKHLCVFGLQQIEKVAIASETKTLHLLPLCKRAPRAEKQSDHQAYSRATKRLPTAP